jgi:hypothetical protein
MRRAKINPESISLNGNAVVIDLDLDAIGLLPVLVDLVAQYDNGNPENAADEVEQITAHHLINVESAGWQTAICRRRWSR